MRPIVDNLEILLDLEGKKKERRSEEELRGRIDYLFDTGIITDVTTGKSYQAQPFPPFIQNIIRSGGLLNSLREGSAND